MGASAVRHMKKFYSNDNVAMVWHVKNMLEQQGIDVLVKNDKLYSIAGEVPVTECMPEVWVKNALHYQYAEQLIAEMESSEQEPSPAWLCTSCGEMIEGNFGVCWNCHSSESDEGEIIF